MQELNQMTEASIVKEPVEKPARVWGMLCHLTALLGLMGIPFFNIIGPLVVWLFKKRAYPFVDKQGRESLNFQISMTIYAFVAALMIYIKLGMLPLWILAAINMLLVFIAAVRANSGETYRYPFTIRLIK
jgi:uncharacterized Tic20 family protein